MSVFLLTEHHLEFLSLKGGCKGSPEYKCQDATLMEITCCGSYAAQFDVIKTFPVSAEAADTTKTTQKC